jgi:hypothetical protein
VATNAKQLIESAGKEGAGEPPCCGGGVLFNRLLLPSQG